MLLGAPAAGDVSPPRADEVADTARATQLLKRQAALPVRPWSVPDPATIPAAYVVYELPRKHDPGRVRSYPNENFRPGGFVIPEQFPRNAAAYQRARLGPFADPPALAVSARMR